jgi:hypothetical protein
MQQAMCWVKFGFTTKGLPRPSDVLSSVNAYLAAVNFAQELLHQRQPMSNARDLTLRTGSHISRLLLRKHPYRRTRTFQSNIVVCSLLFSITHVVVMFLIYSLSKSQKRRWTDLLKQCVNWTYQNLLLLIFPYRSISLQQAMVPNYLSHAGTAEFS